jgi:hypothetical protein
MSELSYAQRRPPLRDQHGPRVAHIANAEGSMVALCGYRARGVMTRKEARMSPRCVVCTDLYGLRC